MLYYTTPYYTICHLLPQLGRRARSARPPDLGRAPEQRKKDIGLQRKMNKMDLLNRKRDIGQNGFVKHRT